VKGEEAASGLAPKKQSRLGGKGKKRHNRITTKTAAFKAAIKKTPLYNGSRGLIDKRDIPLEKCLAEKLKEL